MSVLRSGGDLRPPSHSLASLHASLPLIVCLTVLLASVLLINSGLYLFSCFHVNLCMYHVYSVFYSTLLGF